MSRFTILLALLVSTASPGIATAEDDAAKIAFNNHCRTCHSFRKDDNRMGPSMHGIYGAKSGQVHGYRNYSGGLTDIVWDEAMLDKFIADPTSVSTSTNMIYPPVADPVERAKIIEFLKTLGPR